MKKQIAITSGISIVVCMTFFLIMSMSGTRSVYVINAEVYNNFEMKKEMEKHMITTQQQRQSIIDSMSLRLELRKQSWQSSGMKDTAERNTLFRLQQEVYVKQREFQEDNERMLQNYDEQIWKQLNQYAQDFGKEKGYSIVFGATGDGGIMYADQAINVTEELTAYVNHKYRGAK
jgi:outer membrane protein